MLGNNTLKLHSEETRFSAQALIADGFSYDQTANITKFKKNQQHSQL